jgi:hypothetical protein
VQRQWANEARNVTFMLILLWVCWIFIISTPTAVGNVFLKMGFKETSLLVGRLLGSLSTLRNRLRWKVHHHSVPGNFVELPMSKSTFHHNTHDTHTLTVNHLHEQQITTYGVPMSSRPNAAQRISHFNKYFTKCLPLRTNSGLKLTSP